MPITNPTFTQTQLATVTSTELVGQQWIRKANLLVAQKATSPDQQQAPGLDLSQFHFRFSVQSSDMETPNLLTVRVYNLSPTTVERLIAEFDQVSVQAGYENASYGLIFTGTIRQFKRGKENTTDDFLEIIAGDNDIGYNFGFINTTLGLDTQLATWLDVYNASAKALQVQPDPDSQDFLAASGAFFPRQRTLFNLARVAMRQLADSVGAKWSVQNGVLVVIPNGGVRAGTAINLTPTTGLIGIPEATDNGVEARCLLNPNLTIGTSVLIPKELIVQTTTLNHFRPDLGFVVQTSNMNLYRVLSIDHVGDTRGQEWYSDIVGLAGDPTLPLDEQVENSN